ncbi:hypothetical protein NHH82_20965 [Oxalobacteraceae bacterium OTU3REALA1]|nr:hypothetical protein NHH82_20965 [Oxalobacteraceae bacterium OTU3REALA1]
MSSIDSTGRFLDQIAAQVAALGRRSPLKTRAQAPAGAGAKGGRAAPPDLQAVIAGRVLAIGADDPQRRRKAFRVFLEAILSTELGGDLINDPAFHRLIDKVQLSMEGNPELVPAMDRAGEFLLANAARKK